jgi:hypothetical protein
MGVPEVPPQNWGGSCENRANIAAAATLRLGGTRLEALVAGHVASHGVNCWRTDRELAGSICQAGGRNPHPRSVARARRALSARRLLAVQRVAPGHKPVGARYSSPYGTTSKLVDFRALGERDPLTRGDKRKIARRLLCIERHERLEDRYSSEPVSSENGSRAALGERPLRKQRLVQHLDPELQNTMDKLEQILQARWAAEESRGPP